VSDTYTVNVWDIEEDGWAPEFTGLTKWQVRSALRELYACGWTQISMQVKAETHDRAAARWGRGFLASASIPKSIRRKRGANA
jgi:hypothetical protein